MAKPVPEYMPESYIRKFIIEAYYDKESHWMVSAIYEYWCENISSLSEIVLNSYS